MRLPASVRGLARDFLEADSRWLAVFRIAFGLLLLGHTLTVPLGQRLVAYFTDLGAVPTWLLAEEAPAHHAATLFRFVHTPDQARWLFGLMAAVDLAFAVGLFTRVTGPLAVLLTVSLHHRVPFVVDGSMVAMHLLGLFSVALPLGRHLSVDAYLRRSRGLADAPIRIRSLAIAGFRAQLFVLYFFNVVHKNGETWTRGTAVHYVLWQQRAALPSAVALREHAPLWFSPVATYGTLMIEAAIAALVVLPFARTAARRSAALLMLLLHGSFATLLDLGPFPFVFACAALLLLVSEDGALLPSWAGGGGASPTASPEIRADAPRSSRYRWAARELVVGFFMLHAAYCTWQGNRAARSALGEPPRWEFGERVRDALYLSQEWFLFAPDAPTSDMVLMPVVVLADGRHVDVRRHAPPDFGLIDGRPLDTDYFDQTFDVLLVHQGGPHRLRAYADYVARIPTIERWAGERKVRQVLVHNLSTERPAPGARSLPIPRSEVPYMRDYPNGAHPPRRGPEPP